MGAFMLKVQKENMQEEKDEKLLMKNADWGSTLSPKLPWANVTIGDQIKSGICCPRR
jgi:hypothetical protein